MSNAGDDGLRCSAALVASAPSMDSDPLGLWFCESNTSLPTDDQVLVTANVQFSRSALGMTLLRGRWELRWYGAR